jgi:hypothetical protein
VTPVLRFWTYPEILQTLSAKSNAAKKDQTSSGLLSAESLRLYTGPSIPQTVSGKFPLSWSHYVRLLSLDDPAKRDFYEDEARRAIWSVRQLDRQINSMLYERVALSKKKGELLRKRRRLGALQPPRRQSRIRTCLNSLVSQNRPRSTILKMLLSSTA